MKAIVFPIVATMMLAAAAGDESPDVFRALRLNHAWSKKDFNEIAIALSKSTPDDSDVFKLRSIRFYDLEDSIEIVFIQSKGGEYTGGWKIKMSNDGKVYVFKDKEWFDI